MDNRQCIGAVDVCQGGAEGVQYVGAGSIVVRQQVGDHFGVGLGGELKAEILQAFAQRGVVFDDAVVYHGQTVGNMRVRIVLGRLAMGSPAGMSDTQGAADRSGLQGALQLCHLADGAYALDTVTGV